MTQFGKRLLWLGLAIIVVLTYQNCGRSNDELGGQSGSVTLEGTGTGNPGKATMDISFGSYLDILDDQGQPIQLDNLTMCFKRIHLEGTAGTQNIDLDLNDVPLMPDGTFVTGITIPPGTYHEIKYELRGENCDSGQSISFANKNGAFSEVDEIELKFEGDILISALNNHSTQFLISQIAVALNRVSQSNQIKPFIEELLEGFEVQEDDD